MSFGFLSGSEDSKRSCVAVSYLFSSNSLSCIPAANVEQYVSELLTSLLKSDDRELCFMTIASILSNDKNIDLDAYFQALFKCLNGILDRIPGIIESLRDINEANQLIAMLDAMLNYSSPDFLVSFRRIIVNIANSSCRLSKNHPEFGEHALRILRTLLSSEIKNVLVPSLPAIRETAFNFVVKPEKFPSAPIVLALSHSLESGDQWSNQFKIYGECCIYLIKKIVLDAKYQLKPIENTSLKQHLEKIGKDLRGLTKAVSIEKFFLGLASTMTWVRIVLTACCNA
jgi:hypothetical protein